MAAIETEGRTDTQRQRGRLAATASVGLTVIALVGGDAAMAAIVAGVRHLVEGILLQGTIAAAVIGIGSYLLVGVPQIRLGRRQTELTARARTDDRRTRWAVARVAASRPTAFLAASVVAGPLAVGLATGRAQDRHAQRKTALAGAIFGATWAAVYLGALTAAF